MHIYIQMSSVWDILLELSVGSYFGAVGFPNSKDSMAGNKRGIFARYKHGFLKGVPDYFLENEAIYGI